MKKVIFLFIVFSFTLKACGQKDQTFDKPAHFNAGFYLNGKLYLDIPNSGNADWNLIINKPSLFPPTAHNHDLLYKPLNYTPLWSEILNKPLFSTVATSGDYNDLKNRPQQISLPDAIRQLGYLPIPGQPTSALSSIIPKQGSGGIILDTTAGCYKFWNTLTLSWDKIAITSN